MNLPTLIFVAVALPFTILALFWLFAQSMEWLAPRPIVRVWLFGVLGVLYVLLATWELANGNEGWIGPITRLILGVAWLFLAGSDYRRSRGRDVDASQ